MDLRRQVCNWIYGIRTLAHAPNRAGNGARIPRKGSWAVAGYLIFTDQMGKDQLIAPGPVRNQGNADFSVRFRAALRCRSILRWC